MNRDLNYRGEWTTEDGKRLNLPFKCDACLLEDATYGVNGRLLCTVCNQLQAQSGMIHSTGKVN